MPIVTANTPHKVITIEMEDGTTISDADIAAIITYERNAFGNTKGDMIQPAQIKALR